MLLIQLFYLIIICLICITANIIDCNKTRTRRAIRKRSASQNVALLNDLQLVKWDCVTDCNVTIDVAFDRFYDVVLTLLNKHFPERYITITSRDPVFVTPYIKSMLRERYKLMKSGKIESANALAIKISKSITAVNSKSLCTASNISNSKELWDKVNSSKNNQLQKIVYRE